MAQLLEKGRLTYEQLLSLLLDSNKPLSYFGRKIDSFDQSRTFTMFKRSFKEDQILTIDMQNL
jgi:hypothetical protein